MKAYILAGGRGSRLSAAKGLLAVAGTPIIERVRSAAAAVVDEVVVVRAGQPSLLPGLRTVTEEPPGGGPLAALCAALADAYPDEALIVPSDTPFLTTALLRYLRECRDHADAAVPRRGNFVEPLCAVYGPRCLGPAQAALRAGERRPIAFYHALTIRWVTPEELAPFGEWDRLFLNVNTPEDLELARRLAGSEKE